MNYGIMLKGVLTAFGVRVTEEQAQQVTDALPGVIATLQALPAQAPEYLERLNAMMREHAALKAKVDMIFLTVCGSKQPPGEFSPAFELQYAHMMALEIADCGHIQPCSNEAGCVQPPELDFNGDANNDNGNSGTGSSSGDGSDAGNGGDAGATGSAN